MKKYLGIVLICVVVIVTVLNFKLNTNKTQVSLLALANIEALAKDESDNEKGYSRVPSDCEIVVTGKANSTMEILGIGTVKLNSSGEYRYNKKDGQVRCILDGKELCIPQNC
ncbi:NVEALA domain-containing protein [Bacteroides faecalis]|uniref:Uncharacterized protein n=1 Tax=Bacteroides faecalis TaxID=2447885 RepID=A0A401LTF0_9BACE|nr:NVEALA domain-containing protein [Bacteroides faecalis]GCB34848.1 hypothetical protein KGMB02408_17930 [Bacteroides faecalis]